MYLIIDCIGSNTVWTHITDEPIKICCDRYIINIYEDDTTFMSSIAVAYDAKTILVIQ